MILNWIIRSLSAEGPKKALARIITWLVQKHARSLLVSQLLHLLHRPVIPIFRPGFPRESRAFFLDSPPPLSSAPKTANGMQVVAIAISSQPSSFPLLSVQLIDFTQDPDNWHNPSSVHENGKVPGGNTVRRLFRIRDGQVSYDR